MNRTPGNRPEPRPKGPFSDTDALALLLAYRKDPSNVACPRCGPEVMEVLGFIEPDVNAEGYAEATEPTGEYAVAFFCHECERAIGVVADASKGLR